MIKKCVVWLITAVMLYVVQSSLLIGIAWRGISPDLMLLFTVSFSFLYGSRYGTWIGFMAGLIMDIASGTFWGFNTFSKMIIGYACGSFSKQVFKEQKILQMLAVAIASFAQFGLFISLLALLGYSVDLLTIIQNRLLPIMLMNIWPALLVHMLVRRIDLYLNEKK